MASSATKKRYLACDLRILAELITSEAERLAERAAYEAGAGRGLTSAKLVAEGFLLAEALRRRITEIEGV